MKKPTEQLLTELEAKIKRWQTRLTRASNMVVKLDRQRRRLADKKMMQHSPFRHPGSPPVLGENAKGAAEAQLRDFGGVDLKLPNFLSRNPDAGTVIAAKKTEVDKTKMPLSGRDALAAIKAQSAKVTQRRKKKELQLR